MLVALVAIPSILLAYALLAMSSPPSNGRDSGPVVQIEFGSSNLYSGKSYSPYKVTIIVGVNQTLSWKNGDSVAHTVTAEDGSFDSRILGPGETWAYVFAKPAVSQYYCIPHPWMRGIVEVRN